MISPFILLLAFLTCSPAGRFLGLSDNRIQPGGRFILPLGLPESWEFDVVVFNQADELVAVGDGKIRITEGGQYHPRMAYDSQTWNLGAYSSPDTILTAGPYTLTFQVDYTPLDTLTVFDGPREWEETWFENREALVRVRSDTIMGMQVFSVDRMLLLPYSIDLLWTTTPDGGYRVARVDTVTIGSVSYPLIETHWWHLPQTMQEETWLWAIGYGLLEFPIITYDVPSGTLYPDLTFPDRRVLIQWKRKR